MQKTIKLLLYKRTILKDYLKLLLSFEVVYGYRGKYFLYNINYTGNTK